MKHKIDFDIDGALQALREGKDVIDRSSHEGLIRSPY